MREGVKIYCRVSHCRYHGYDGSPVKPRPSDLAHYKSTGTVISQGGDLPTSNLLTVSMSILMICNVKWGGQSCQIDVRDGHTV